REEALERDCAAGLRRELLAAQPLAAGLRKTARGPLVFDDTAELSRRRWMVEAEDLDRRSRPGLLDLLAPVVVEGAPPTQGVAGDDRVAHAQGAAVNEHRRDRAAADVEPRLDDRAGALRIRICLQLELGVGDEQHLLEELVEVLLCFRRDVG